MPIEVDQRKLKLSFIWFSCYSAILAVAPLSAIFYLIGFAYTLQLSMITNFLLLTVSFIVYARFTFTKHQQMIYLFDGKYYGKDKEKIRGFFYFAPMVKLEALYLKLPLPYVNLQKLAMRNRKTWRSYK